MSEMYNGTAKIPPEKFEFVHSGERIADKKFEDKPIGYFKDAWIRFRKNHASVVATIIIICIVLFAFLTPIFNTRYNARFMDSYYAKKAPRALALRPYGIFDGGTTRTFSEKGLIKAIAIGVPYDGDFWDFFSGKVPEQALPVGTVLTIAASGSEGSPDSIITNEKTLEKNGAEADCLRPCFSVLDPALTESLPAYQTACGITDIMAHTFERYFTNTPEVEVTDRMLEGVLLAMLHEGRRVMEDPHNYEARANIMWAGMVCHNDIMGVGRQQDWNSHHLEHVLSAKYDCAHGAGLAVIMPAWMHYCAEHGGEKRLAQMAVRVFGCQMDFDDPKRTALEGIEAFRAFLRSIGMPLTFAEIGADPTDIPELVEMNHIGDGKTGGYIGLDRQAHFDIYNLAAGSCVPET